jgi:phage gp36-like protein
MAYATTTDLTRFGLPSAALSGIATAAQEAALDAASVFADSYLRSRYGTLPLTSYGVDLTQCVCALAAETLLTTRGFDATRANGDSVTLRADNARAWLRDVSAGRAAVSGGNTTAAATPIARASSAPTTSSTSERGW